MIFQAVRQTRLPNGVRIISAPASQVESVAVGIWAGVGGRHESAREAGISHFIEHMLFKGTRKRSAKQISQAVEGRGGYLNAFTQEESTCYYARIAWDYTWQACDVLEDMFLNPRMATADIERERQVIVEEIMMYRDQPHHAVQENLRALLWQGHPLGTNLAGSPETVRGLGRADILGFKRRGYVPRNTIFAFAGRVDHDACVRRVRETVGRLPARPVPGFRRVGAATGQGRLNVETREIEQTHLAMGFRLFGRRDPRRYALKNLSAVLGENMSSRLFQVLRERHGLAYAIQTGTQLFQETGVFLVSAGLDRKRSERALGLTVRELVRMRDQAVGAAELKRAKDYVIGQLRLGLEGSSAQMTWLGENLLAFGRFIKPEEVIEALNAVTADEVRSLARHILRPSRLSTALIAPGSQKEHAASIRRRLRDL